MPITFDTLDELKAFYRDFQLIEKNGGRGSKASQAEEEVLPKRGRPGRKPGRKPSVSAVVVKTAGKKRGPKPKAAAAVKAPRAFKGDTLTSKIRGTIQKFLDGDRSFTANDVYDDLSKRDSSVNKQSVITSVLKQMNSVFSNIAVTERPGNGPRPVKLYNP